MQGQFRGRTILPERREPGPGLRQVRGEEAESLRVVEDEGLGSDVYEYEPRSLVGSSIATVGGTCDCRFQAYEGLGISQRYLFLDKSLQRLICRMGVLTFSRTGVLHHHGGGFWTHHHPH